MLCAVTVSVKVLLKMMSKIVEKHDEPTGSDDDGTTAQRHVEDQVKNVWSLGSRCHAASLQQLVLDVIHLGFDVVQRNAINSCCRKHDGLGAFDVSNDQQLTGSNRLAAKRRRYVDTVTIA